MLCVLMHLGHESGFAAWLSHMHGNIADLATHDGRTIVFDNKTPECCLTAPKALQHFVIGRQQ